MQGAGMKGVGYKCGVAGVQGAGAGTQGCSNTQFAAHRCMVQVLPSRLLLSRGHQWLANRRGRISAAGLSAALCGLQAAGTGTAAGPELSRTGRPGRVLCGPRHPPAAPPAGEATHHGCGVPLPGTRACTVPSGLGHPKNPSAVCVVTKHGDSQVGEHPGAAEPSSGRFPTRLQGRMFGKVIRTRLEKQHLAGARVHTGVPAGLCSPGVQVTARLGGPRAPRALASCRGRGNRPAPIEGTERIGGEPALRTGAVWCFRRD